MTLANVETGEIAGFRVHPAAQLFPLILGSDFEALVEDIRINGQMDDVVLDRDGLLIDGRNRARACERLDLTVRTTTYGGDDVWQFVVSHNLHRRHLTDSQRAIVAAEIASLPQGGDRRSTGFKSPIEDLKPTQAEVGAAMQVSRGTVTRARAVIRDGIPALADLAKNHGVSIDPLSRVSRLPVEEQEQFVAEVLRGGSPAKLAPPREREAKAPRPAAPPRMGPRRKHLAQIEAITTGLSGYAVVFEDVDSLDASVTAEEAVRLKDDLSTQIRALNRIIQLLKERT